jgi:DNA-binding beta-propeller fold protein YncE
MRGVAWVGAWLVLGSGCGGGATTIAADAALVVDGPLAFADAPPAADAPATGPDAPPTPPDADTGMVFTELPSVTLPSDYAPGVGGSVAVNRQTGRAYVGVIGKVGVTIGVVVIDVASGDVITTATFAGCCTKGVAVDETTNTIYAADSVDTGTKLDQTVHIIDGATNQETGSIVLGTADTAWFMDVDPVHHRLYAYDDGQNLVVIDTQAKTVVTTVALSSYVCSGCAGSTGGGVVVDPDSRKVWVLGATRADAGVASIVTTLDGATNQVTGQTPIAGVPIALSFAGLGQGAFVVTQSPDAVQAVDPTKYDLPDGYKPDYIFRERWGRPPLSVGVQDLIYARDSDGNSYEFRVLSPPSVTPPVLSEPMLTVAPKGQATHVLKQIAIGDKIYLIQTYATIDVSGHWYSSLIPVIERRVASCVR